MNRPTGIAALAAAAALLLLPAGCATFQPDEDFDVSLVNVTSGEVQPWETTLVFTVRLLNARPQPVQLRGASHKILLDGTKVGTGLTHEAVTVPALGETSQSVTVRISNFQLARKIHAASQTGKIGYEVRSVLYDAQGRSIRAVHADSLDFSGLVPPPTGTAAPMPRP